jgi:flagellar basal body-associated protein FliL
MNFTDTWLLTKKILIGIVITLVPLAILAGGLWLTQWLVKSHEHAKQTSSTKVVTYAN